MTIQRKIITVFAATGSQGGAVVRSLLQNKTGCFEIRALTRDPSSEKSQELVRLGASLVQADGWSQAQMTEALRGSWAAFINTNSDDPVFRQESPTEFDLGKIIVDSLVAADVPHVVYSSFASSLEQTGGKLFIRPMELKNRVLRYAQSRGHFTSVCPIYAAWYYEQFLDPQTASLFGGFPFTSDADGYVTFHGPLWGADEPPSFVSIARDFGDLVHGILLNPVEWNGRPVPAASDTLTFDEMTAAFEKATNRRSRYIPMASWEDFGRGIPELDEHRLLFAFTQATGGRYYGDVATTTEIAAGLKRAAAEAKGKHGVDAELLPMRDWFRQAFAGELGTD